MDQLNIISSPYMATNERQNETSKLLRYDPRVCIHRTLAKSDTKINVQWKMKLVKYSFDLSEKFEKWIHFHGNRVLFNKLWYTDTIVKDFKVLYRMVDNFNIFHLHTKRTSIAEVKKKKLLCFSYSLYTLLKRCRRHCHESFQSVLWNIYAYLKCKEWNETNWRKENWKLCIFDAIDMKQLTEPWSESVSLKNVLRELKKSVISPIHSFTISNGSGNVFVFNFLCSENWKYHFMNN